MERTLLFLMFSIFVVTGALLFVSIPGTADMTLLKEEMTLGKEGELCRSPTLVRDCERGLRCVVLEQDFYTKAYCLRNN